jgi:hypothetical protein
MIGLLRALFFLDAAIWLIFAAATFLGGIPGIPDAGPAAAVMAALMLGNATALAVAGWGLGRQTPIPYFFAVVVLVVNMVLTITDQMGVWDWLILALEAAMLGLLLGVCKRYVGRKI